MQIEIVSDIHLTCDRDHGTDFLTSLIPEEGTQVLIVAGDVGEFHWWLRAKQYLDILCANYPHVLFVAGNHDYYGTTLLEGDARFREIARLYENFHFLEEEVLELDGKKFAGCTLWFKWDEMSQFYERWMNDFEMVKEFKPAVYDRNASARGFLDLQIPEDTDVVITHHMPSELSVHEKYANDPCNRYFLCAMDETILRREPKLWVHGHTHIPCDYRIGSTRVVCNPRGYPRENPGPYNPVVVQI